MEPPSEDDSHSMKQLREIVFQNIKKWLANSPNIKNEKQGNKNEESEKKEIKPASWNAKIYPGNLEEIYQDKKDPNLKPRPYKFGRLSGGNLPEPAGPRDFNSSAFWIEQQLDHFDSSNLLRWKQRFWNNKNYYKPGGPIFLMISGESPAGEKWIENPNVTYLTIAKQLNANVYMLEHRYYGYSRPTADQSTANLKFLSSEQALADVAVFINTINKQENLQNPKWITFGGSYSGALSAWFRQKYSNFTVGAVGSSGPVYAKVDFFEYLQVVEASIRSYSNQCADNIGIAFADIQHRLTTIEGRNQLNTIFKTSVPFNGSSPSVKDVQTFMASLIGSYQGVVQTSGDNTQVAIGHGIKEMCDIMTNAANSAIQNVRKTYELMYGQDAMVDNHYSDDIAFYKNTAFDINNSAARSWFWQTCTEFGYYQSTDLGKNIFGSAVPVDLYIDSCTDVFGPSFNRSFIDNSIAKTQKYYGGNQNYSATNVVLPNGSLDPWHALGLYTDGTTSITSILITGTAHCADMYPSRDNDLPALVNARQKIVQIVSSWIYFYLNFIFLHGQTPLPNIMMATGMFPGSTLPSMQIAGAPMSQNNPEIVNKIVASLFPNQNVDDVSRNAIAKYISATDQVNISLQALNEAKQEMMRMIPQTFKATMENVFAKQRDKMVKFIADLQPRMLAANNSAKFLPYDEIIRGLTAYMGNGQIFTNLTAMQICFDFSQLSTASADIVSLVQHYFNFDPRNGLMNQTCQHNLFGLISMTEDGKNLQQPSQPVSQAIKNASQSAVSGVEDVVNKMGTAAQTVGQKIGEVPNAVSNGFPNVTNQG
uniref:Serine protease n=1 Tax=Panagrolaimus sp. JU765 TaxID=591449 RepID=A0AC34QUR0_9BILA